MTNAIIEAAEKEIQRQNGNLKSKQPRFADSPEQFYMSVLRFVKLAYMDMPPYVADSRTRDSWLRNAWKMETYLSGVMNSAVAIDKNRGWSLVGGRNQVRKFTNILHNLENGEGWRAFVDLHSKSFYEADINAIAEVGRDGTSGPMGTLWHVDPARCSLTGSIEYPLDYYPKKGKRQRWKEGDFFRTASMRSTDESFNELGYCAISRCIALAQTMIAITEYDQEQLGARAPQGLLLLHGITQDQWTTAMKAREADLTAKERMYYGGVEVLASLGAEKIEANLLALSNLPANFDKKTFTDLVMFGYALAFGYDPTEFWPVQFGALGRGRESEVQHQKATGKGGRDFTLSFQENIQRELPDTIHFEFDERDEEGELLEAEVAAAKESVITRMYESGLQFGQGLITREEARSLLAEANLIPREWTEIEETSESTDLEAERARAMELSEIRRSAYDNPNEPIIIYNWPTGKERTLWESGEAMLKPRLWKVKKRQAEDKLDNELKMFMVVSRELENTLYNEGSVEITQEDVNLAVKNAYSDEFKELLEAETIDE